MMNMFEQIACLTEVFGPSGREWMAARCISSLAKPYADEITTDTMGNLIVHKRGTGPKLMLSARMDTSGLVVTYIEEDGMLRVGRLGNLEPKNIRNAPVRFTDISGQTFNGVVRVHGKANEEKLVIDDLYIDIGAGSREEAQKLVQLGDAAVFATPAMVAGNRMIAPYLDNRVSCAALLNALELVKESAYDLYCVFTVQGELASRGVKTAAYGIEPHYAISIDVTDACDWPGAARTNTALGKGVGIKVMDPSTVYHPQMVKRLSEFAEMRQVKYQKDVQAKGSAAEAGTVLQSRCGVVAGGLSIPCRGLHTPTAIVDLSDVEACVGVLTAFIENK